MFPRTASWWGRIGELLFLRLHPNAKDIIAAHGNRSPYDALDPILGRVDVKTAGERVSKHGKPTWHFVLGGASPKTCDHFFFVGFAPGGQHVVRAWVVPSKHITATLTPDSKEYTGGPFELPPEQIAILDGAFQELLAVPYEPGKAQPQHETEKQLVGKLGENIYKCLHPESRHVSLEDCHAPHDFEDPDGTMVNVKVRRPDKDRGRWTFLHCESKAQEFFFLGLDEDCSSVRLALRVPREVLPQGGFSIREGSESHWLQFLVPGFPRQVEEVLDEEGRRFLASLYDLSRTPPTTI